MWKSIEICAGAGGQALGLEEAGFEHLELVEIEPLACQTLNANRSKWRVSQSDVRRFSALSYKGGVDLLSGGVPCPPFSIAGKQLGQLDERDLFPEAIRLIKECEPKAVLLENVRGLFQPKFDSYRREIISTISQLGYKTEWKILNAVDYGVSQERSRSILVAIKAPYFNFFQWPEKQEGRPVSIGDLLFEEMSRLGWEGAYRWKKKAEGIAPTVVGGSKKHGGADLGPTRAREVWSRMGIDATGLADSPPALDFEGNPRLTLQMVALIQGFPKEWCFRGKKTPAYRQIGNAFPPPVAKAIGLSIHKALCCEK
ncbi:MAG: DNA cytosine methyltransferase [Tannerellaceae bacterium]|jgi:DNA (cytosine-5)-methyltransferase 1|nr:DNA cytosine methyltransferase [Tannerellaceae bacterium]